MAMPVNHPVLALDVADVDERTPGVFLLWSALEGDAKHTARDDGDSWWMAEWETSQIGGITYWRVTEAYRIDKQVIRQLATAQERIVHHGDVER